MNQGAFIFKGEKDEGFTVIVNDHCPAPKAAEMIKAALPYAQPFSHFNSAAFAAAFVAGNLNKQTTPAEIPASQPKPKATKSKGKKGKSGEGSQESTSESAPRQEGPGDTPLVVIANNYRDHVNVNFVYKLVVENGQALIVVSRVRCTDPENPKSVNSWDRKKTWNSSLESFFNEIQEVVHPLAAGLPQSGATA